MIDKILFLMENPWVALVLLVWSLTWKGLALWRAAKANQRNWFVVLLVVNTVGLLEIFYLFLWDKVWSFLKLIWKKTKAVFKK